MKISLYLSSEHSEVAHCERCIQIRISIWICAQGLWGSAILIFLTTVLLLLHHFLQFGLNCRTRDSLKWQIVARASRSSAPLTALEMRWHKCSSKRQMAVYSCHNVCWGAGLGVHIVLMHQCMLHVECIKNMHTASQIVIWLQTWCFKQIFIYLRFHNSKCFWCESLFS